jgi:hypothetical protein
MCMIQIKAQSNNRFLELLPDETENAELTVEHAVSHLLVDLFGEVAVNDVTILFPSTLHRGLKHYSIQICALCSCNSFALLPRTQEHIKLAVAKHMGSLLSELFGSVKVDDVTLSPSSWACRNNPARAYSN